MIPLAFLLTYFAPDNATFVYCTRTVQVIGGEMLLFWCCGNSQMRY